MASFSFGGFGGASTGAAAGGFGAAPAAGGFGAAAPAVGGFGAGAPAAGGFGGFGATASTGGGFGGFGASSTGASTGGGVGGFGASTGASTGGIFGGSFGASTGASTGGGFGGFGASTGAKLTSGFGAAPAAGGFGAATGGFGTPAATGGFGATNATTGGGFGGLGAAATTGAAPAASTGGFGAPEATSGGFGAPTAGGFGAPAATGGVMGFVAAAANKPTGAAGFGGGFGATTGGGFGAPAVSGFGATGVTGAAAAVAPAAPVNLAPQHHSPDAMKYLVQPLCGMGNFLGSGVIDAKDKDGKKLKIDAESREVYQAINVQLISWSPWDPAVMTQNAKMQQQGCFAAVQNQVNQLLQSKMNVVERERELAKYKKEDADLIRLAMLPRFDTATISDRDPKAVPRQPCDVVENQMDPCDWKPEVDNPHCRFRHYILQPLTQAQMRLPVSQRHGFNQSAESSPNDPLFQSKLQENPNPYKYCVLPIVGFHQLERRVKMQDDKIAEQNAVMMSFEHEVIRMREFQSVEFPIMLAQRRAKQVELGRRTIEILRRLEARREPTSAPSRREEEERRGLNDGLDQLCQDLGSAALQRKLQQLEELMAEVRMQDRKRLKQRSVASSACDPLALERLDKFLEHRLQGIKHISDIVQKDYADAQIMLQHLGAPM